METIDTFLSMGGYGAYVWPAYSAMFVVFLINIVIPLKQAKKIRASLRGDRH